jgi:PhoPQ-activated pathogenicity-related protein
MVAFLLVSILNAPPKNALETYLAIPQPVQKLRNSQDGLANHFVLTSQTWQGIVWEHDLLFKPSPPEVKTDTAILFITGDGPRPGDQVDLNLISGATKLPIAMLFDVPNQPIWSMKEDDLIAHTFSKYLETKDATWPLLFPMTRAAVAAMDEVVRMTANSQNPIRKFIVTGASKRGWTTWLTAATRDSRVVGIAPMVFDNLNFDRQMQHQLEQWGGYSIQIEDYTKRGLQAKLNTTSGKKLLSMVDPFSYRGQIRVPTLIVNGANDAYWTADATSQYWSQLRQPKWVLNVPNAGHSLGNKIQTVETVSAFARSLAARQPFPKSPSAAFNRQRSELSITFDPKDLAGLRLWVAAADDTDFRPKVFRDRQVLLEPGASSAKLKPLANLSEKENAAFFAEVRYRQDGREFSLSTPTIVVKR